MGMQQFISDNERVWAAYKCEKCRYYALVNCANLRCDKPSSSEMNKTSEEEEDANIVTLPLANQTYNIMTDILFKESKEMSYSISHEHPLILVDTQTQCSTTPMAMNKQVVEDICDACVEPIMDDMPFYKCTSKDPECNYVLHEWCTWLPTKLKGHIGHPQHTLLLRQRHPALLTFNCGVCGLPSNGFAYSCKECFGFHIDVICALTCYKIRNTSHPHHNLIRLYDKILEKAYCSMCLIGFTSEIESSLSCKDCQFHLHLRCAFLLPETTRHKYDKHPMTLSCGPVENHDGDYFCEVCEEEFNPNGSFYHCHECVHSIHTTCAPIIPQSKPYIFSRGSSSRGVAKYFNIKFGSLHKIRTYSPTPYASFISSSG